MNTNRSKGHIDVLLGAQWGDEGKGKVTDNYAYGYDLVARYQGGPNAGHTLIVDGKTLVLHVIPSGVMVDKPSLLGEGMVIDLLMFFEEIKTVLTYKSNATSLIKISRGVGLILPVHKLLDHVNEYLAGVGKIGSTLRGIGPAYEDQTGRRGPKYQDTFRHDAYERFSKLQDRHTPIIKDAIDGCQDAEVKNFLVQKLDSLDSDLRTHLQVASKISDIIEDVDCGSYVESILAKGRNVLAEGAQGFFLDHAYGTYPYVTSSITSALGAPLGLGVSWTHMRKVVGVFKAYCTRVGKGPFPTEYFPGLDGHYDPSHGLGYLIQKRGGEVGSTTGRPRQCGALDLPALRYAVKTSGMSALVMTKIDVFNGFDEIELCVGYKNMELDIFRRMGEAKPIVEKFRWGCEITSKMKTEDDLPSRLRTLIQKIEDYVGVPIIMISVGPNRDDVISLDESSRRKCLTARTSGNGEHASSLFTASSGG